MSFLQIKSEISGTVWKLESKLGDELAADATLMILEAMKMEIPVLIPRKGRVVEIRVAEGEVVEEGQLLAVLEPV